MPLPPEVDQKISGRFEALRAEGEVLSADINRISTSNQSAFENWMGDRYSRVGPTPNSLPGIEESRFFNYRTKVLSLMELLRGNSRHISELMEEIRLMQSAAYIDQLVGILSGLKDDYDSGMLMSLSAQIEASVMSDYLEQAEQLLGANKSGQYGHVPAAVLTGAILEDSLRRLCDRQTPPLTSTKPNGEYKMLNALIDDLKKAGVFNELKAKQLRSWADIRNAAAHGQFDEFARSDVEQMLKGVQAFLADYM